MAFLSLSPCFSLLLQEESPSALRILEEDNKKLKEELVHISISLQHSKKEREREAREAAEENSGKERKRIDELEAAQVRKKEEGGSHHKSVLGQRETRGLKQNSCTGLKMVTGQSA